MVCHQQLQFLSLHTLFFILFALLAQLASAKPQGIYRCPQPNAPPLFSGSPCPSTQPLEPSVINGYTPPTLTPAEQQQLQRLGQRIGQEKSQQPDRRKVTRKPSGTELRAAATTACKRQQVALRALQNRRRKGYKLSEAARLDHQEQSLRQDIRLHC